MNQRLQAFTLALMLSGAGAAHAQFCPVSFAPAVNHGVTVTYAVATADLNSDGRLDVVMSDLTANAAGIWVLLGNGDGTFQAAVSYGNEPLSGSLGVAIADLNADARPDVVFTNFSMNHVSVLLGNGDGTFQSAIHSPAPLDRRGVAVGDLNADARQDLVLVGGNTASVLLGNGNGTFQFPVEYNLDSLSFSVAIGDLNADGRPDFVATNHLISQGGGAVSVLLGNGNGTFQNAVSYGTAGGTTCVVIGDLNNDGRPDLAAANNSADSVSVLLNNGSGTFQPAFNFGAGLSPSSVAIGDLNRDGQLDLVTANEFGNNASVLLGNGTGTFPPPLNFGTGVRPLSVAIGNLNADGEPDLVFAASTSQAASVLLNTRDSGIIIGQHPADLTVNSGQSATFSVQAPMVNGRMNYYRWRRNGVPLGLNGNYQGQFTDTLTISPALASYAATYDVEVSNGCGPFSVISNAATLTVICPADHNNDGFINSQDFFHFLVDFFAADPLADFNHDGFVNSQDYFDFLAAFFVIC